MLTDIAKSFSLKKLPASEVELVGEVPFSEIEPHQEHALKHIIEHLEMPGFRKGHVPADMARKQIGEIALLEEAVEHYMADLYPALIAEYKLEPIGRPQVQITKLAPGNPVGLTIRTYLYPEIKLPDYKKLAGGVKKEEAPAVTDEEVTKAIDAVRESHSTLKDADGKAILPEVTDAWVKEMGPFENVAQFTDKLREHLGKEKEQATKEKRRAGIIDAVLEKTNIEIPAIFVEAELEKMLGQMKDDIKRFGMTFEDYLTRLQKTEDDLRKEFRADAEKRAKLQLTLNAIAEKEEIKIPAEDIKHEAEHILAQFKDADRERVHIYVESVLKNEKTLSLLETA